MAPAASRSLPNLWRRCVAEGVGTFFLVFVGAGTVMADAASGGAVGPVGVALAFTFVVTAMIYATGHLSGAHINPAVTVAFWSAGHFRGREVPAYAAAQCSGAVAAALLLRWLIGPEGGLGATVPAVSVGRAFAAEAVLTFALMLVITAVATDERVADGVAGAAVGITVGMDALVGGGLTGASMNPARSLGPAVAGGGWEAHWLYWTAPFAGAVAAALLYEHLRPARVPHVPTGPPLGVQGPIDERA